MIIDGVFWLAEQGLAFKRVLLVVIPLFVFFNVTILEFYRKDKGEIMKRKTFCKALKVTIHKVSKTLSGGIAGSALLAKAYHQNYHFVG